MFEGIGRQARRGVKNSAVAAAAFERCDRCVRLAAGLDVIHSQALHHLQWGGHTRLVTKVGVVLVGATSDHFGSCCPVTLNGLPYPLLALCSGVVSFSRESPVLGRVVNQGVRGLPD